MRRAPLALASLLSSIAVVIAACDDATEEQATIDDAGATDGDANNIDVNPGSMKGCQLPHDCQGMRDPDTCSPLAIPAFADGGAIVLDVDACKVVAAGGAMPAAFTDETGRHLVTPGAGATFCASSLLERAPALESSGSGYALADGTNDLVLGTSRFAVLAVAIYRASTRSNQMIFAAQEQTWPFRGPALVTNFAWADREADGGDPMPPIATPTNYVAGQLWWGSEPLTGGPSPGRVAVSQLPYDCKPHVFRLSRSAGNFSLFVDGRLETEQLDAGAVDLTGPVVARLGAAFEGAIGQVLVVKDADDADVVALETDLKRRWKIP